MDRITTGLNTRLNVKDKCCEMPDLPLHMRTLRAYTQSCNQACALQLQEFDQLAPLLNL